MRRVAKNYQPRMAEPDDWSEELNKFVARACEREVDKRAQAWELLKDEWLKQAITQDDFADVIAAVRKKKSRKKSWFG